MLDKANAPKAIVIGATSGIGRALVFELARRGYTVGATGRRDDLLKTLADEVPGCFIKVMDVTQSDMAIQTLEDLFGEMGGCDLVVLCAGTGFDDPDMPWDKDKLTIDVNVTGYTALANWTFKTFKAQGQGHLVGISSIAAVRGAVTPVYNATKAYVSSYMEGLRVICAKERLSVSITDIRPGFVDTVMAKGEGQFWVAPPELAAKQICSAISKKKKVAYITKRWRLIAWLLKVLPDFLYHKL